MSLEVESLSATLARCFPSGAEHKADGRPWAALLARRRDRGGQFGVFGGPVDRRSGNGSERALESLMLVGAGSWASKRPPCGGAGIRETTLYLYAR